MSPSWIQTDAVCAEWNWAATFEELALELDFGCTAAWNVAEDGCLEGVGDVGIAGRIKYDVVHNRRKVNKCRGARTVGDGRAEPRRSGHKYIVTLNRNPLWKTRIGWDSGKCPDSVKFCGSQNHSWQQLGQ